MGIGGLAARQAVVGQRGVLGQRHDAPRHADPVVDLHVMVGHIDVHQLGRSAADVEDQRRAFAGLHQIVAAQHREPGFLGGRNDVEDDPRLAADAFGQLFAVARAAARLGRHRARQRDMAAAQLVGADRQRGDGAVHRRVADPPAAVEPFAQPHDARKGVDHDQLAILRARDKEPAIVGAKVDRGIAARPRDRHGARFAARFSSFCRRAGPRRSPRWRCHLPHGYYYLSAHASAKPRTCTWRRT